MSAFGQNEFLSKGLFLGAFRTDRNWAVSGQPAFGGPIQLTDDKPVDIEMSA